MTDNISLYTWEITVELRSGDWVWMRTETKVSYDDAVDAAIKYRSLIPFGRLISIIHVSEPSFMPRQKLEDRIEHFLETQAGPNPLTDNEIKRLAEKHPERWALFARGL